MDSPETLIAAAQADANERITKSTNLLLALPDVREVLNVVYALPSFGALKWEPYISTTYRDGMRAVLTLTLNDGPSTFVRELVRALGVNASKRKAWDSSALVASLTYKSVIIEVTGYIPPTCEVVYEDVVIPASAERVERRARIVCEPSPNTPD